MLEALGGPENAIAPYREAVRLKPGDARAHGDLGRVLLEAGQLDEAIKHCSEAARLDPKSAEAAVSSGRGAGPEGRDGSGSAPI